MSEEQAEQFGMTKEQAAEATMHAEFEVLGVKILCSDSFGRVENINNGISLLIDFDVNNQDDSDKVQQFYDKIKNHDSLDIEMPLKEQFWVEKWAPLQINMAYVGCYMVKTIHNLINNHIDFIKLLIKDVMTSNS